ncbi:voltage-gated H+ channel [Emiliania huxleyi CCMP1516]|uniref:Voltage-gated hydrogen channel 1 n=2 Tax=Emiliania huxleyi TaxID=2903 RepID=A0A0D3IF35_EMIH1|nr:voltage-gated H+ channel [Emiliania huxleyi CCMP1516]EOD09870.1 voltage-gated H+ channel [Emiliania huxleyi CCMP1516]|mmetsp:Transcript_27707/g.88877  ORF Transcript_27707/g.88877 Transcript_27707/m.88877 type:complete len:340 (-) Transcript_27707:112-1131(-)|eukprot:XP_005762299.1 voltage-gated H+ channel [Emiliania huxleyi CCMP1516]
MAEIQTLQPPPTSRLEGGRVKEVHSPEKLERKLKANPRENTLRAKRQAVYAAMDALEAAGASEVTSPKTRYGARAFGKPLKAQLLSARAEVEKAHAEHGADSWQRRCLHLLHSHRVQLFFILLLVLDMLIVITEICLDLEYPSCRLAKRDTVSCCAAGEEGEHHTLRYLAEAEHGGHHSLCGKGTVEGPHGVGCDEHAHPAVHTAHAVLTWASVAILSLFEIELLTLLAASGLRDFFSNVYYVLDIVIVSASLVLECVFYNTAGLSDLIGLVMFLRLWRLLRIGHAMFASTERASSTDNLKEVVRELRAELDLLSEWAEEEERASARAPPDDPGVDDIG